MNSIYTIAAAIIIAFLASLPLRCVALEKLSDPIWMSSIALTSILFASFIFFLANVDRIVADAVSRLTNTDSLMPEGKSLVVKTVDEAMHEIKQDVYIAIGSLGWLLLIHIWWIGDIPGVSWPPGWWITKNLICNMCFIFSFVLTLFATIDVVRASILMKDYQRLQPGAPDLP